MKKCVVLALCACLLTGCSAEVFETLGPIEHVAATMPQQRTVALMLPADAAVLTAAGEHTLYVCDNFSLAVETMASGDLHGTLHTISGFEKEKLTVMEQSCGDHKRYDLVWTAAGEEGDILCRAAVIDDGHYHYCLTAMVEADQASAVQSTWNDLFASYCLEN